MIASKSYPERSRDRECKLPKLPLPPGPVPLLPLRPMAVLAMTVEDLPAGELFRELFWLLGPLNISEI